MTAWQIGSLVFFGYVAVVAAIRQPASQRARMRAIGGAAAGAAIVALSRLAGGPTSNTWIVPPALLLIGYWTTGLLFVEPMHRLERSLASFDEILRIDAIAARIPRVVVELLEVAYSAVYPMIPLALYIAVRHGVSADRFWTVILLTDYICFGMLPWFQTRPPRAVGFDRPWRSRWRAVNLRALDAGSVGVNTFPSGHAAEALAAALLVSDAPGPVTAAMFVVAGAISAGAVFGRYHYAADAIAGWVVALLIWTAV